MYDNDYRKTIKQVCTGCAHEMALDPEARLTWSTWFY